MQHPKDLLRRYGLSPRKSLGQNFLVDPGAPARIVGCADIGTADTVLEVGAGLGSLTTALAERAGHVLAVETDPHLLPPLQHELETYPNVSVVQGDILELDPAILLNLGVIPSMPRWGQREQTYVVVANLPYYITALVLRHLLEADIRPRQMVVTVQREVAQRITARPGDMSLLAVSVQFYGKVSTCLRLKRGAFYPIPQVESAVLKLDLYAEPPVPIDDVARFFQVVRAGFAQRRKQLRNTLAASLHLVPADVAAALTGAGVDATRRAQTLSLEEWGKVVVALAPLM